MALINQTAKNLRRSPYQALTALVIVMLTFFLASRFVLLTFGAQMMLSFFESRPQVSIFFKDSAKEEDIKKIREELESTGKIASVKYISKEEALSIYREQNKEDPTLLELVTADILPASLEVSAKDPMYLGDIAEIAKTKEEIEEVVFQKEVVDQLKSWTNSIRTEGLVTIGSLGLVSLVIILSIIAMRISARREEINIMQLVGATPWYIRAPFILEGAFYGFIGSLFGSTVGFIVFFFSPYFQNSVFNPLFGLPVNPFTPIILIIVFAALVFVGALLGSLGSFLAVFRYLR
ncbi:hypothetical protein A2Z23_02820 [Candidatus Curtissbacteria bacterium RBG_16_39_7]|uniref:Cell division protein FtsX n=1 Tax=Candidatus Curtissbacteria bacterium RBG_16_39_7 TaxID=1797707 RepID=A0A1F5G4M3_9BACT|nr:MAG: hypothetical protein A2Z23_02820 [Candidatus Curtissbacteria bacterium RBG_16_39_7]